MRSGAPGAGLLQFLNNNVLVDAVAASACTRDSATAVTVVIPATADFDISANETVTLTIPAADLVTSGDTLVATPTMTITHTASGGTETITGMTFQ